MTYSLLLKDTLPSGKILHVVKYNDSKNYSFIYDTEQDQGVLDAAVDKGKPRSRRTIKKRSRRGRVKSQRAGGIDGITYRQ